MPNRKNGECPKSQCRFFACTETYCHLIHQEEVYGMNGIGNDEDILQILQLFKVPPSLVKIVEKEQIMFLRNAHIEAGANLSLKEQLADQKTNYRFWRMFDEGAKMGELAAEFRVPANEVREYLRLPPLDENCPDPDYEDELNDICLGVRDADEEG